MKLKWFKVVLLSLVLSATVVWPVMGAPTGERGSPEVVSINSETCIDPVIGTSQSPIDLVAPLTAIPSNKEIQSIFYPAFLPKITNKGGHEISVIDNPSFPASGSKITINSVDYKLTEFHFHTKSEHHLNGTEYPMEIHIKHQSTSGQNVVIGVFVESVTGPADVNETLTALLDTIPVSNASVTPSSSIDLNLLLPDANSRSYYHYDGSLTTCPFTEGIKWYVFHTPIKILNTDLAKYNANFAHNDRNTKPLNGRTIYVK
ncbi:carbonic anhydrase family protein [Paenibacillus sp. GSMTC-2017]|uniref:carbonic anhydrase family protein n=1 Tax=Paenibacillus sp. GSMTC-2017 TaxID=2794350 RepID=UPI0018D89DD5|nr:carbonic anhydrase family protein [Paenibacillus sp. GSMTC-2017]MBH5316935.1 carbonic anhydrase family protein [Paenibacillus sp. GSMTC-2017]